MIESNVFVRTNPLRGLVEISTPRGSAVETWDAMAPRLEALVGADVATFFARPAVVRGNGETETGVSWYVPRPGVVRTWGALSSEERVQVGAKVARLLERLRPALADPEVGSVVDGWLNLASLDDDLVLVGEQPHLLNWGLLPEAVAADPAARHAHARETLGKFGAGEPSATRYAAAPAAGFAAGAAGAAGAATSTSTSTSPTADVVAATAPSRAWVPLLVAVVAAALLLVLLLIPGVLVFPHEEPIVVEAPATDPALVAQVESSLRERIAALQSELTENSCRVVDAEGVPPTLGDLDGAPPSVAAAPPLVTPPPATLPSPPPSPPPAPGQATASPGNLLEFLDRGTAFVVARSADGTGFSSGSAFFVNERQLVTNLHVIEAADPQGVGVLSPALGSYVPARIVATSAGHERADADFAVLEVEPTEARQIFTLADRVERMQAVIAVGYPGFVLQTDDAYQRMLRGDDTAIPQAVVTQGSVVALHTSETGMPLVVHLATIANGNSGGPLVDVCGRAVGVNTFGRRDPATQQFMHYALQTRGLREFLDREGIAYTATSDACEPAAVAAATLPPTAEPADPEPSATDSSPVPVAVPDSAEGPSPSTP